jgi:LacI family transcriptional regulator, gluconate utilization system Gnt-I transcriptional repressor
MPDPEVRGRRKSGKPTLDDVAVAASVSPITVSRALRNPGSVSSDLRERIHRAVAEIGYVPNTAARALASARTNVIGVLVPSITNSVFSEVLQGMYDAIEGTPFQVQFGNTNYSPIKEEQLLQLFLGQRPAAILVTGHDQSSEATRLLRANNCPVVQIMDIPPAPVDMAVGFSHSDAAEAATRHLIERGYRRIGFAADQMDMRTRARIQGYSTALQRAGLFDERLIVTTHKPSSIRQGSLLCSELLSRASDVDALQANNDNIALGALFECHRRRIRIPEDFGIMGFNDFETAAIASPSISSVHTYRYEMGRAAIAMAIAAINGTPQAERVVDIGFDLAFRESTARS